MEKKWKYFNFYRMGEIGEWLIFAKGVSHKFYDSMYQNGLNTFGKIKICEVLACDEEINCKISEQKKGERRKENGK